MIGSQRNSTKQNRRLTTAGLIAVTTATLLMMAWAIFPMAAFADGTVQWEKHQGLANGATCPNGAHWILSPPGDITSATLHVGSQNITMNQNGPNGSFEADSVGLVTNSTLASADFTSPNQEEDPALKLSHCLEGETSTQPPPPEKGRIVVKKETIPNGDPATFNFTGEINTVLGDGGHQGKDVVAGTYTVSESVPTGWTLTSIVCSDANSSGSVPTATFQVEAGETVTCTFTNTKDETSTTSPAVRPTTVEPSQTDDVAPTTVSPGGTAFTGVENVVPIGAIALMLMTSGTGLLWAGSRRKRDQNQDEE